MSAYDDAVAALYALSPRGVELGLDRMREALAAYGDPHRGPVFVHVGGTNGKGSVSALLESMFRAAGHRTGLYTSPHLHRFVERIRVDGHPMSDDALVRAVQRWSSANLPRLTFFEAATMIAFDEFRRCGCEVVVLEVGLGGRLDSTNVVDSAVSVLTNVGLEHTQYLGTTHEAIAAEKVAIARPSSVLVHGVSHPGAREVVERYAEANHVALVDVDRDVVVRDGSERDAIDVAVRGESLGAIPLRLRGEHQRRNLAIAVAAAVATRRAIDVPVDAIRRGAASVRWPGRLELLPGEPEMLLDGAHNPDGCAALASYLGTLPRKDPTVLVFGAMADKDLASMLGLFDGLVDTRVYVAPELARAARPEVLASVRPGIVAGSVRAGLDEACRLAGSSGRVVVAGSLFVVADARAIRLGERVDPPIAM